MQNLYKFNDVIRITDLVGEEMKEREVQKENLHKLNLLLKKKWDQIAYDYYNDIHPTSRNFDAVIDFYLPHYVKRLPRKGLFLDLGGGAGKLHKFVHSPHSRIIIGDISINMLKKGEKSSRDIPRTQLSAFQLPFYREVFDGVVSILGDAYMLPQTFQEVYRILKFGGIFIIALPSKVWASTLRSKIGISIDETVFASRIYQTINVPSFLYSEIELDNYLVNFKFRDIEVKSFTAKGVVKESKLSPHILMPCNDLEISPYELPIITIAFARKVKD